MAHNPFPLPFPFFDKTGSICGLIEEHRLIEKAKLGGGTTYRATFTAGAPAASMSRAVFTLDEFLPEPPDPKIVVGC